MRLHFSKINRAGLDRHIIKHYQEKEKCKKMIEALQKNPGENILPPVKFYSPQKSGLYSIADGIHRICALLYVGILEFDYIIQMDTNREKPD